jgi:hypothetical protein
MITNIAKICCLATKKQYLFFRVFMELYPEGALH